MMDQNICPAYACRLEKLACAISQIATFLDPSGRGCDEPGKEAASAERVQQSVNGNRLALRIHW